MTNERSADRQLEGLRSYATRRREATVERLRVGIDALTAEGQPITARTIWERTGLAYNSYARNPEAYALYRQASSHLMGQRRRRVMQAAPRASRDPWLAWSKTKLVARLRALIAENDQLQVERSVGAATCQERHAVRIMLLEAQLAAYGNAVSRVPD
jgi:hypothetical protein